jgi:hypothetical protein
MAATKQAQHVNANAMCEQVDYDVEDELHLILVFPCRFFLRTSE